MSYVSDFDSSPPPIAPDTSHLLWSSHMFTTSELEDNSITPATILTLLTEDDSSWFTPPIYNKFARLHHFRLQIDGGANRSVTKNRDCLHTYWDIASYRIGGIDDGIICTGKGIFHLLCDDGSIIPITMFFSADATETVISPTDAVFSNSDSFDSWWQMADCKTGAGNLRFYKSDEITIASVPLVMRNKLWYLEQDITSTVYRANIGPSSDAFVRAVTGSTLHNLWHHRLCHAGKFVTDNIGKGITIDDVSGGGNVPPLHSFRSGRVGKGAKCLEDGIIIVGKYNVGEDWRPKIGRDVGRWGC